MQKESLLFFSFPSASNFGEAKDSANEWKNQNFLVFTFPTFVAGDLLVPECSLTTRLKRRKDTKITIKQEQNILRPTRNHL